VIGHLIIALPFAIIAISNSLESFDTRSKTPRSSAAPVRSK
jgi:ABC-type spermidine/putrescine transport system permease subunit II